MHTPVEVTEAAVQVVDTNARRPDCDRWRLDRRAEKGASAWTDCRKSSVPTTYAGSEMTPILGETRGGIKTTRRCASCSGHRDLRCRSDPGAAAGPFGIERNERDRACRRKHFTPWMRIRSSLMAGEGIRHWRGRCPVSLTRRPTGPAIGCALWRVAVRHLSGAVGMSLHHKLCHVLGGSFDLPHALTHAIVLPHVPAYNTPAAPEAISALPEALRHQMQHLAFYDCWPTPEHPEAASPLGMPACRHREAADLATRNPYAIPGRSIVRPCTA